MNNNKAIGMVETLGMLDAVKGIDAALKSANVTLTHFEKVGGGLVSFFVTGDVGAVKAAVDACVSEINSNSTIISSHVIPRISNDTDALLKINTKQKSTNTNNSEKVATTLPLNTTVSEHLKEQVDNESETTSKDNKDDNKKTSTPKKNENPLLKRLEKMSLAKLKSMAHEECGLGKDEVKNMKKQKLINVIVKHYNEK